MAKSRTVKINKDIVISRIEEMGYKTRRAFVRDRLPDVCDDFLNNALAPTRGVISVPYAITIAQALDMTVDEIIYHEPETVEEQPEEQEPEQMTIDDLQGMDMTTAVLALSEQIEALGIDTMDEISGVKDELIGLQNEVRTLAESLSQVEITQWKDAVKDKPPMRYNTNSGTAAHSIFYLVHTVDDKFFVASMWATTINGGSVYWRPADSNTRVEVKIGDTYKSLQGI